MNSIDFSNHITGLISKDNLSQAIKEMSLFFKSSPQIDELIMQSARYNDLKRQIRLGTVKYEDATVTKNKILMAVLELSNEITDFTATNSALMEEADKSLHSMFNNDTNQTKINIQNNIHGDNIGGDKIIHN